jgi:hypothetical protein
MKILVLIVAVTLFALYIGAGCKRSLERCAAPTAAALAQVDN